MAILWMKGLSKHLQAKGRECGVEKRRKKGAGGYSATVESEGSLVRSRPG